MWKAIRVFIWFVTAMIVWKYCGMLITMNNDLAVLGGLFVAVFFAAVTYFTNFFTKFKL